MDETRINASLDTLLHHAREGDVSEARKLHEFLDSMLLEREQPEGKLWLTDHGRLLLAEMHRHLANCKGDDRHLGEEVLEAVELKPHPERWPNTCAYLHDLRVATAVANELCEQSKAGRQASVEHAAQTLFERGDYGIEPERICEIYDRISSTIAGFREISRY
jgi:hypothetical protein